MLLECRWCCFICSNWNTLLLCKIFTPNMIFVSNEFAQRWFHNAKYAYTSMTLSFGARLSRQKPLEHLSFAFFSFFSFFFVLMKLCVQYVNTDALYCKCILIVIYHWECIVFTNVRKKCFDVRKKSMREFQCYIWKCRIDIFNHFCFYKLTWYFQLIK